MERVHNWKSLNVDKVYHKYATRFQTCPPLLTGLCYLSVCLVPLSLPAAPILSLKRQKVDEVRRLEFGGCYGDKDKLEQNDRQKW